MENKDVRELIKEVLDKGYLMSLATMDDGGVWVADVIYVHDDDDFNIYWMSYPNVRHSQAILENPKVAGTITASEQSGEELGIQLEGIVEKIDGPRFDLALKFYSKRKKPAPKEADDILEGHSWYCLKPKRVELIHGKLFGFEKQKLSF